MPLVEYATKSDLNIQRLRSIRPPVGSNADPYRVDLASAAVYANAALAARVENINGYWPMATARLFRFAHWMRGFKTSMIARHELNTFLYRCPEPFPLRILNVLYASAVTPSGELGLKRDADPSPRAWLVDQAEVIPDDVSTVARLYNPEFDPGHVVILTQPPRIGLKPAASPLGSCRARKHENGGLDIETRSSRDGYLVLSEIFYPGWRPRWMAGPCRSSGRIT